MNPFIVKIPVLRSLIRLYERRNFERRWRSRNSHNETKVGERYFEVDLVQVGKGTYGTINVQNMYAQPNEKITIGNYVSIAPNVTFLSGVNHQIDTVTTFPFYSKLIRRSSKDALAKGPIVVEDEVWLGTGAMIFSGVTIAKGAVVAAGSLVTKDVAPYAIVGGNPAKLIRYRFSPEIIELLQPIRFADLPVEWIRQNIDVVYQKIQTVDDARRLRNMVDDFLKQRK